MKIALFIPCYINALYPQVGEASYRLLRRCPFCGGALDPEKPG